MMMDSRSGGRLLGGRRLGAVAAIASMTSGRLRRSARLDGPQGAGVSSADVDLLGSHLFTAAPLEAGAAHAGVGAAAGAPVLTGGLTVRCGRGQRSGERDGESYRQKWDTPRRTWPSEQVVCSLMGPTLSPEKNQRHGL